MKHEVGRKRHMYTVTIVETVKRDVLVYDISVEKAKDTARHIYEMGLCNNNGTVTERRVECR